MLCAYYDKTCDSHELFSGYRISENGNYEKYLNQYDVIYLDLTNLLGKVNPKDLVKYITANVTEEILDSYPEVLEGNSFDETLINCVSYVGNKMIMIIDEWDAPIRETPEIEEAYLKFLRMLYKAAERHQRFLLLPI